MHEMCAISITKMKLKNAKKCNLNESASINSYEYINHSKRLFITRSIYFHKLVFRRVHIN